MACFDICGDRKVAEFKASLAASRGVTSRLIPFPNLRLFLAVLLLNCTYNRAFYLSILVDRPHTFLQRIRSKGVCLFVIICFKMVLKPQNTECPTSRRRQNFEYGFLSSKEETITRAKAFSHIHSQIINEPKLIFYKI